MKKLVTSLLIWSFALVCQANELVISDPYGRASPPGTTNSAAFMLIQNTSKQERALISAKTTAAQVTELHTMVMHNQHMQMRKVESIAIPAEGETKLQPGGFHIMLLNLVKPLKEGESITIDLNFDDGSTQTITAPVKSVMKTMKHSH